jgi:hypothetical protein
MQPVTGFRTRETLRTPTPTRQNSYPWWGYGFLWVGVRVALGNPRVTRNNHYQPLQLRTVKDIKKKMIFYTFGLVRDRKRLKFACNWSLNHQNLMSSSPAKQDLCSDSREKFGQPQKNRQNLEKSAIRFLFICYCSSSDIGPFLRVVVE